MPELPSGFELRLPSLAGERRGEAETGRRGRGCCRTPGACHAISQQLTVAATTNSTTTGLEGLRRPPGTRMLEWKLCSDSPLKTGTHSLPRGGCAGVNTVGK